MVALLEYVFDPRRKVTQFSAKGRVHVLGFCPLLFDVVEGDPLPIPEQAVVLGN